MQFQLQTPGLILWFGRMERMMERIALVLGASGGFGGAIAQELAARGWTLRRFQRGTDMAEAARGAGLIVNGLNPPMYHDWARLIPQITGQVLAAAKTSGATVLMPGNVYPFGVQPAPWGADTPHRPVSRKGAIRATMEARYQAAAKAGEARVILLRAGDFMGTAPHLAINSLTLRHIARGRITTLGNPDALHAFAWLPDMARAGAALAERDDLPPWLDLAFPGHSLRQRDIATAAGRLLGRPLRVAPFPAWVFPLLSPVWELARELREMLYLWDHPHWLDAAGMERWLPGFTPTSLDATLAALLRAKGLPVG